MTGNISYMFKFSILLWGMDVLRVRRKDPEASLGLTEMLKVAGSSQVESCQRVFILPGRKSGRRMTYRPKVRE